MCRRNCTKRPKDTAAIYIGNETTHAGAVDGVGPRRAAETTSSVGTAAGRRTAREEEVDAREDKTRSGGESGGERAKSDSAA